MSQHITDRQLHRNVWLSSWVLTICLLGDALLYVILPVHADAFGVSLAAVGFLLAVNRIIRTFTYGLIVMGLGSGWAHAIWRLLLHLLPVYLRLAMVCLTGSIC